MIYIYIIHYHNLFKIVPAKTLNNTHIKIRETHIIVQWCYFWTRKRAAEGHSKRLAFWQGVKLRLGVKMPGLHGRPRGPDNIIVLLRRHNYRRHDFCKFSLKPSLASPSLNPPLQILPKLLSADLPKPSLAGPSLTLPCRSSLLP